MTWTVIRSTPNGLRRTEHIDAETGEIIRLFRIEADLNRINVEHYAPSETSWIRHRKTNQWEERRQSLMPYIFLNGDINWLRIEREVRDTWGPVRKASGAPIIIPEWEIERLRAAQLQIDTGHALAHRNRHMTRKRLDELYPAGSTVEILTGPFQSQQAVVLEATGRRTIKAMLTLLGGTVAAELSVDDVKDAAQ